MGEVPPTWTIQTLPQPGAEVVDWLLQHFGNHWFLKVPRNTLANWMFALFDEPNLSCIYPVDAEVLLDTFGTQAYADNIPQLTELNLILSFVAHNRESQAPMP